MPRARACLPAASLTAAWVIGGALRPTPVGGHSHFQYTADGWCREECRPQALILNPGGKRLDASHGLDRSTACCSQVPTTLVQLCQLRVDLPLLPRQTDRCCQARI